MRDLGFSLNAKDFSDRILNLQLVRNPLDSYSGFDDSQNSNKKQKTRVSTKSDAACEESSNSSTSGVKTLLINSGVLASCSPFFYKLFKNGMKESQERIVALKINQSEEGAFMDLLHFVYTDKLSASSAPDLLAVLMLAYKFEVTSCASYCSKLLEGMEMSLESAISYVEIPPTVLVSEEIQSLIDEAEEYFTNNYADWREVLDREEALALPLSAIKVVLGGELRVRSEDDVYEFILRWGRAHYPDWRERRQVVTKLMEKFIHFPYLRISTLKEIQESPEFDSKKMSNLILESLYMNAGYPFGESYRVPRATGPCVRRDYDEFPIKETQFGSCHIVYLNIGSKWHERYIFGQGQYSQIFFLGGQPFKFWVEAESDSKEDYLSIFLERVNGKSGTCTFDYELGVQTFSNVTWKLESIQKFENCSLSVGNRVGSTRLFGMPWDDLVEKSNYFVNRILPLRAQFTINDSHP